MRTSIVSTDSIIYIGIYIGQTIHLKVAFLDFYAMHTQNHTL